MALSNTTAESGPAGSGVVAKGKEGSEINSGRTESDSVASRGTTFGTSIEQMPKNLSHQICKSPVLEGAKEATTHDFLSLYKNAAVAGKAETSAAQGILSLGGTQDFLQPLEKCAQPISGNILTAGFLPSNGQINHYGMINQSCYGSIQDAICGHSGGKRDQPAMSRWMNGLDRGSKGVKEDNHAHRLSSQLKFGTQELSHGAKFGSTHSHLEVEQQRISSPNHQWQHSGSDVCNMAKEPQAAASNGHKDEYSEDDNESTKKEVLTQKGDVPQR